jgi:hypothetical protein
MTLTDIPAAAPVTSQEPAAAVASSITTQPAAQIPSPPAKQIPAQPVAQSSAPPAAPSAGPATVKPVVTAQATRETPSRPLNKGSVIKLVGESRPTEETVLSEQLESLLGRPQKQIETEPDAARSSGIRAVSYQESISEPSAAGQSGIVNSVGDFPVSNPDASSTGTPPRPLTWQEQLQAAVVLLEQQIQNSESTDDAAVEQIRWYLLRLVAGSGNIETFEIKGLSEGQQQFWQHQLASIQVMLNGLPDESSSSAELATQRRRATTAARQLEMAANQLASQATLQVANAIFCTQVQGFGQFVPAELQFTPGQQTLVYCEIENYDLRDSTAAPSVASTGQPQFVAELRGQFMIVDDNNLVVHQHQYQTVEDISHWRRKDFYMYFPVAIPQLPAGHYRLQLSVEDLVGKKFASVQPDLEFSVIEPQANGRQPRTAMIKPPAGNQRQDREPASR